MLQKDNNTNTITTNAWVHYKECSSRSWIRRHAGGISLWRFCHLLVSRVPKIQTKRRSSLIHDLLRGGWGVTGHLSDRPLVYAAVAEGFLRLRVLGRWWLDILAGRVARIKMRLWTRMAKLLVSTNGLPGLPVNGKTISVSWNLWECNILHA